MIIDSTKTLEYCICGGKYPRSGLDDLMDMVGDMSGGFQKDNLENIINKAKDK